MADVARQAESSAAGVLDGVREKPVRASSTRSVTSSTHARTSRRDPSSSGGYAVDDSEFDEEAEYEADDGDDDDDDGGTVADDGKAEGDGSGDGGQELMNETTVKSGYLYKRGEKRKNWKKRWFVLRSAKLYYYKNEKEYQLLRFIDMTEVHTIAAVSLKKAEHCFGISTSKRQYYVRASNAKEMQTWVDALRDVREQVRQRSTITRDLGMLDVGGSGGASSGGEQAATKPARPIRRSSTSTSPNLGPVDRASNSGGGAAPISIMIPGKGLYTAPAQPRLVAGGTAFSPLSSTSDSEAGAPSGAEQFGLSYASSAGQSLASSPGRSGVLHLHTAAPATANAAHHHHHHHHPEPGSNSPTSQSGGDDAHDVSLRKSRMPQRAPSARDTTIGITTAGPATATAAADGGSGFTGLQRRSSSQQPQVLSSSEEEGDGDEWDEDEEADRAMPLPGPGGLGLVAGHGHAGPPAGTAPSSSTQQAKQAQASADVAKPKVAPEFFKDARKVIHQGYLMKQSSRRKQWRKRWFVLTSGSLSYTRSHMDGKLHRQIPLSSILDAIEYTSKKTNQQSAPLSPNLSAFSSGGALAFGRSPLLGGGGEGSSTAAGQTAEKSQGGAKPAAASSAGITGIVTTTGSALNAGAEQGVSGTIATGTLSSGEGEGVGPERKVSVAAHQPTAAAARAEDRQIAAQAPTPKRKKENCFKIITPKRVYVVCAPTEEEELKWLSALQALLAHFHENKDDAAKGGGQSQSTTSAAAHEQQLQPSAPSSMISSPSLSGGVPTRLNPPSISLSKPLRSNSQDDTHRAAAGAAAATPPSGATPSAAAPAQATSTTEEHKAA